MYEPFEAAGGQHNIKFLLLLVKISRPCLDQSKNSNHVFFPATLYFLSAQFTFQSVNHIKILMTQFDVCLVGSLKWPRIYLKSISKGKLEKILTVTFQIEQHGFNYCFKIPLSRWSKLTWNTSKVYMYQLKSMLKGFLINCISLL